MQWDPNRGRYTTLLPDGVVVHAGKIEEGWEIRIPAFSLREIVRNPRLKTWASAQAIVERVLGAILEPSGAEALPGPSTGVASAPGVRRGDPMLEIVDLNDVSGEVVAPAWLARAEAVHRQLRPQLSSDYPAQMRRVFAGGGRMCVAVEDDAVLGVAVYRIYENTFSGIHMYVDDLVTDERRRSSGVGRALSDHLQAVARQAGCTAYTLDSGTQRERAHKFYFREGMTIVAFHFERPLI